MFASLKQRLYRFLRWSERYTKTDMVYTVSGGFWAIVSQTSSTTIAFLLSIIVARYIPKDVYGTYKYALSIIAIIGTFSLTGLGTAVFQAVANGNRGAVRKGFTTNIRWSIAVFVGAFIVGSYFIFLQHNMELGISILFGGCLTPFLTSYNLYNSLLAGEKDFKQLAYLNGFITSIIPAIGLALVAIFYPTPLTVVGMYFIANTLAAFFAYHRATSIYKLPKKEKDERAVISYGKHLSAINILSAIASNIDQILLFHFTGAVDLAIYNFAIAIPNQAKGPLKSLSLMIQARFVKQSSENIRASNRNKMLWLGIVVAIAIILYIIFVPFIFRLFFPAYLGAVAYSRIFVFSLIANIFIPASAYFIAKKKVREQYKTTITGSLLRIGLYIVGVIYFGLLGVVVARVVSACITQCYAYLLFLKTSRSETA